MGDGIMALFGAPLAHEDHAVRACYAAWRMHESVQRYADGVRRSEGLLVQIRVGLNSGEVVVRSIGSDLHMDYTAVGQTHLAARMEQLAAPGTTLVSADTLRLAEGYVQVKALGPITVKGLSEPVDTFELTGAGTARTRLQSAALRGLTRFVGRDAEVEHLRRVLTQADGGRGQVVARTHQERGWEAWGLKLLGDVRAHEPAENEQSGDAYRRVLAQATELGMRPLVAHCHFGLGKIDQQSKRTQAREHFTTATTMYREMDQRFWLEQVEMEMRKP